MKAIPAQAGARVVKTAQVLIEAGRVLGVPVVVTEQYPRGLGPTVADLKTSLGDAGTIVEKTSFSCTGEPKFAEVLGALKAQGRDEIVLAGVEAHICVFLTARDLVASGFKVFIAADGVASRSKMNWRIGLNLATTAGAVMTNTETVLFDMLKKAGGDEFKAISALIK